MKINRLLAFTALASMALSSPVWAQASVAYRSADGLSSVPVDANHPLPMTEAPAAVATTRTNGTITTPNTFQSVLASNTSRKGCRITNTSATAMTVDLGASPSSATAIPLPAGSAFTCDAQPGYVISDQVNLADATATSTYVVWSQ